MQKIIPCLWFDREALEAVKYYLSIFKNSRVLSVTHYGKEGHEIHGMPEGSVLTVEFQLNGQRFTALNGGPFLSSTRPSPSRFTARARRNWTITGTNFPGMGTPRPRPADG